MTTYLSDLEELHDIMDTLVFEDESTIFTEEHAIEVVETAFHLMEELSVAQINQIGDELNLKTAKRLGFKRLEEDSEL